MEEKYELYLITNDFPFGQSEASFILPELPYLKQYFHITIISCSLSEVQTTCVDEDIDIIHYNRKASIFRKLLDCISLLGEIETYIELWNIITSGSKIGRRIFESVLFGEESKRFERFLKDNKIFKKNAPSLIYCYWFDFYCLTMTRIFKKDCSVKIVTRAHRYDLYDDARISGWQPYKQQMDHRLNSVIFISEHGRQYYLKRYCKLADEDKYPLFRLGVSKPKHEVSIKTEHPPFLLVSCSLVIPRKRVNLIVRALSEIRDDKIHWVHFGNGEEFDKLKEMSHQLLDVKNNISYELKGYVEADQIMEYYEKHYVDAFITTTASEGCPVSVQEAMACGIPIIGTKVAEIPYMIKGNGILLSENPDENDIARAIHDMYILNDENKMKMRAQSKQLWEQEFDVRKNASCFSREIYYKCINADMKG